MQQLDAWTTSHNSCGRTNRMYCEGWYQWGRPTADPWDKSIYLPAWGCRRGNF